MSLWIGLIVVTLGLITIRIPPVDGFMTLTLAPILLILGYIVLIPYSLCPKRLPTGAYFDSSSGKVPKQLLINGGIIVFVASFAIYMITLWPGPGWWDSSQYITASHTLGVTSPPGSFMLELIGRIAATVIPFLSPSVKINMLMALFSSLAAVVVYFIVIRVVRSINGERSFAESGIMISGIAAALSLAFTHSIWCKATFANAYALSLLTGCLLIYLAILWWERAETPGGGNYLLLAALLFGLDLSVHRSNLLFAPFFVLLIIIRSPRAFLDWRLWLGGILMFFIGFSMQFAIMLRAQLNPEINLGNPDTLRGFWDYFNMRQFNISIFGLDLLQRKGPFWSYQIKEMYLRYIGWNFIGLGGDGIKISFSGMYGIPLLFGIIGVVVHFVGKFKYALMLFIAFLFASLGAVFYLNVPAGFFREMDRHFAVSFMFISVWIGVAVYAAMYHIPRLFMQWSNRYETACWIVAAVMLLILPLNMFRANFSNNNMSENHSAQAYGCNLLESCDQNAILITAGDSDTFTAWYCRMIEKNRPDMMVMNIHLLNTPWYLNTLLTYHPDIPWTLTPDSISQIRPQKWDGDSIIIAGSSEYTSQFRFLPKPGYGPDILLPADQVLIDIIRTNNWRRPICFSSGFGDNIPLGLHEYCRSDGLVWKLCPNDYERADMARLEENLDKYDYRGIGENNYLDPVGQQMKRSYMSGFFNLAGHYKDDGDTTRLENLSARFDRIWPGAGGLMNKLEQTESQQTGG